MSSTARRRPGLELALEAVRSGKAQAIITAKLDRLARSTLQAATLFASAKKEGWDLVIADIDASTAGGRFMRNVMAAAAEYEHELISVRTRDALAAAKARGIHVGRPHEIAPELEQEIVTTRRRRRLSARAIARELEAAGTPSPRGGATWHASTVADVLHRADLSSHTWASTHDKAGPIVPYASLPRPPQDSLGTCRRQLLDVQVPTYRGSDILK